MRKTIITTETAPTAEDTFNWFNLEQIARAELSSELPDHPFEHALLHEKESYWCAAEPGPQTVRLIFDEPQHIQQIELLFEATDYSRTQQFTLDYSTDETETAQTIVRQQYNFSQPDARYETECLSVDLHAVTSLTLHIQPDISGGDATTSLCRWRIA